MINLTTGPVDITDEVIEALNSPVISHRSAEFIHLHYTVTQALCNHVSAKQAFLMTGSGTMANDSMLYQIKALNGPGIILINGEFGNRLSKQAQRLKINFVSYEQPWGTSFHKEAVAEQIRTHDAKWVLCCHCETSTGQVIDLNMLRGFNREYGVKIFLDCMSTFGTMELPLTDIAMATASTAKGIGSLSGLAMVFSNIELREQSDAPLYLDLFHLQQCKGIPFTISSNLIAGLNSALHLNSRRQYWKQLDVFSKLVYNRLAQLAIIPFAQENSRVFTLQLTGKRAASLGGYLRSKGIKTSFESQYLKERNWLQLALFSVYTPEEIEGTLKLIETFLNEK